MVPTATSKAQRAPCWAARTPRRCARRRPRRRRPGSRPRTLACQRDASPASNSALPTTSLKEGRRSGAWEHKVRFVACLSSRFIGGHRPRGPTVSGPLWAPASGRPALGARPRLVTDPRVPPLRRGRRDHAAKDTRTDRLVCRSLPARCRNHEALATSPPARRAWRPRGNRQPLAWHWLPTVRRILVHPCASWCVAREGRR